MTHCLFVGGPADGQILGVDTSRKTWRVLGGDESKVRIGSPPQFIYFDYERHLFVDVDHCEHFIYFPLGTNSPMWTLINSYAKRAAK